METKYYINDLDDNQLCGLMSMIKTRDINPHDYDRKIKFWSEMIAKCCEFEKDPIFSIDILKRRFRRGDQIPGSLDVVLDHLLSIGELSVLGDFKMRNENWLQWGYKRVIASFWGAENDSRKEFVHLKTVIKQADRMLHFFQSVYALDGDILPEIVDSSEFYSKCSHIFANKRAYECALSELVHRGEVTFGLSKTGEEILKFRNGNVRGPIKWTQSDTSIHDMRRAMTKLENEIKRLEGKAKKAEEDARIYIRKGDKNLATHHLRLKKRAVREIEAKDNQYQKLLDIMHQLGQTLQNKQILDVYKTGAEAFMSTLQRQGISRDEIDETMDSICDAMETAGDIQDAISGGVPSTSDELNKELNAELDSILAEDSTESAISSLPKVPIDEPSASISAAHQEEDSIANRLKRLRQVAG